MASETRVRCDLRGLWWIAADNSEPDRRLAVKAGAVAPPLRGFGLDGLTPSRFELSKQTKADWERPRFQSRTERQPTELDGKKFPQTKPQTKRKF